MNNRIDYAGELLEKYDLVLYHARGLNTVFNYGMWNGSSVTNKDGIKISISDVYKVRLLNDKEQEIKERLLKIVKKNEEAMNLKPIKNQIIGRLYKDTKGVDWLYLGKRKTEYSDGTFDIYHTYIKIDNYDLNNIKNNNVSNDFISKKLGFYRYRDETKNEKKLVVDTKINITIDNKSIKDIIELKDDRNFVYILV